MITTALNCANSVASLSAHLATFPPIAVFLITISFLIFARRRCSFSAHLRCFLQSYHGSCYIAQNSSWVRFAICRSASLDNTHLYSHNFNHSITLSFRRSFAAIFLCHRNACMGYSLWCLRSYQTSISVISAQISSALTILVLRLAVSAAAGVYPSPPADANYYCSTLFWPFAVSRLGQAVSDSGSRRQRRRLDHLRILCNR